MHIRWHLGGYTWMDEMLTGITVTQDHAGGESEVLFEQSFQCPDMGDTEPAIVLKQVLSSIIDQL